MGVPVAQVEKEIQAHGVQMEWALLALLLEEHGGVSTVGVQLEDGVPLTGTLHPLTGAAVGSGEDPRFQSQPRGRQLFSFSRPIPEGQTLGGRVRSLSSPSTPSPHYKAHELDLRRRVKHFLNQK